MSANLDPFSALSGENARLLEEKYEEYLQGKSDSQWNHFFRQLGGDIPTPATGDSLNTGIVPQKITAEDTDLNDDLPGMVTSDLQGMGVHSLMNLYRKHGHLAADLDPLKLLKPERSFIDEKIKGLSDNELKQEIDTAIPALGNTSIQNLINWLETTYCKSIGAEHFYLIEHEERQWLQQQMELNANNDPLPLETKKRLYRKVYEADAFEKFLARKYVGKKRFSLEGADSLIPMLDSIIELSGDLGIESVVMGMAHRGRLNVLNNVLRKPASLIFAEFEENYNTDTIDYADVKYHLGYSTKIITENKIPVKVSLAFNPSHLEAVNPVVLGSVRARQRRHNDLQRTRHLGVLIHGDAAFMGQGVVPETLNLNGLTGYTTGGTIHIVVNNQIGFTTSPHDSRSTLYATDLAKGFQIPIFHVNGDDPEAVYRVIRLAMQYRQKFGKDVMIDLVAYRRLGHNEMDEPNFTQPVMYSRIKSQKITAALYREKLAHDSDIESSDIQEIENAVAIGLDESFNHMKFENVHMKVETLKGQWSHYLLKPDGKEVKTSLAKEELQAVIDALTHIPAEFKPNKKLLRFNENRQKMFQGEMPVDWSLGEALAYGSLLAEGRRVRISGQDSQRGTFSHRHAVFNDAESGSQYIPLNHIYPDQPELEVHNSPLSEFSVLGFEYGYSLADPAALVIWEAQFGDFVNGAQVIIDQFISSSEIKWYRMSGIVMFLPHGYEGQGPEHSSARLERFLQLCAQDNMQVVYPTTPAQIFHLLRKQVLQNYRKPLIVMTPKSLLRKPEASSDIQEIFTGSFMPVLPDPQKPSAKDVERVLLINGKVYYDLKAEAENLNMDGKTALLRLEQIYPFPEKQIQSLLEQYPNAKTLVYVQEEPANMGALSFVKELIIEIAGKNDVELRFVSRKASASPAAGLSKLHDAEQKQLLKDSLL